MRLSVCYVTIHNFLLLAASSLPVLAALTAVGGRGPWQSGPVSMAVQPAAWACSLTRHAALDTQKSTWVASTS